MPIRDLWCECGHEEKDVIVGIDEEYPKCPKCGETMKNLCRCASFQLKYDPRKDTVSWGNEGYATSRYWDAMKDAKAAGKKVAPADEVYGKTPFQSVG